MKVTLALLSWTPWCQGVLGEVLEGGGRGGGSEGGEGGGGGLAGPSLLL